MVSTYYNFGLLCIVLLINGFGIIIAWKQYKTKGYLPPTIIAHVGLIFYGALPPLYMFLAPESSIEVFGRYGIENTGRILLMYIVTSFGCLMATIIVRPCQGRPMPFLSLCTTSYVLAGTGALLILWIYDRTWAQAGGIYGFLFSGESRMLMNQDVFGKSIYSFFNYYVLFKIFFSLLCIGVFSELKAYNKIRSSGRIAIFLSSIFPLMNIMGGTRLIALHAFTLCFIAAALYIRVRLNLRVVLIFLIVLLSFNYIGQKRKEIRHCFADSKIYFHELLKDAIPLSLIPSEAFTGYVPAYIIFESGEEKFMEPQYIKPIPRIIANFIGIKKKEHMSKLLSIHGKFARNLTVFTVSLPVDAYFGLNRSYGLLALYGFVIFSLLNWLARYLVRLNSYNGWVLYMVLMGLVWVYIRYDVNRAFSRTWQSLLFSIPIILLFYNKKSFFNKRMLRKNRLVNAN